MRILAIILVAIALSPLFIFAALAIQFNLLWLGYIFLYAFFLHRFYSWLIDIANLDDLSNESINGEETIGAKENVAAVLTTSTSRKRRVVKGKK